MKIACQKFERRLLCAAACFALAGPSPAAVTIATRGQARVVFVQAAHATAPEQHALAELVLHLNLITGAHFEVQTNAAEVPKNAILVGQGSLAAGAFPEVEFTKLAPEEFVIRTKSNRLLLAGGRPRGTIYAVSRFLQEQCGVRWWTPWATNIPHRRTLRIPDLDVRQRPAFEYREPYWFQGFDPLWKARNGANGQSRLIPAKWGGCITYKGFCHTFYPLVPPEKHFDAHPEWYSLIKGKRTHERAQLCLSNPELRDFMVERVKAWLREAPDAEIISVTQNDWHGACECANCQAIDDAEGSQSGSMLAFVNYVAEKIELEFPNVAVDTFAYQYTRKPPKTIKPRPNVIVRLCSIECNFREPLDHPSNARFLADLEGWSRICRRLYIWDYTTDFKNYVNPHPNWFVLGPNLRLFQKNNVRGVFEQGAYNSWGGEFGEMRAWVLAQLLWNPQQDDRALINEFLDGYYGKAAAKPIRRYLQLMHDASQGFYLACFLRPGAPHLNFETLNAAESLWLEAERAVAKNSELLARVRLSHLPVHCAILRNWERLRYDCWEQNAIWPMPKSRKLAVEQFARECAGFPGKDWTHVNVLKEHSLVLSDLVQQLSSDPQNPPGPPPPKRLRKPPPPADLTGENLRRAADLQDNLARLAKPGQWAEIRPDLAASDLRAVWMPANHSEWAFRISNARIPESQSSKWKLFVVVRAEIAPDAKPDSIAFGAGVYDDVAKNYPAEAKFKVADLRDGYRSYSVGTFETGAQRDIFIAPASNPGVKAIWVDRVYLVPAL